MAKILVCDDDKDIVEAIDIYLTQEGYEVLKAYDGDEAIKVLKRNEVDLLIMDVMMMSRKIAVKLYSKIIEYRPEWHSDDIAKGTIKVIMTSAASDPPEFHRLSR